MSSNSSNVFASIINRGMGKKGWQYYIVIQQWMDRREIEGVAMDGSAGSSSILESSP